MGKYFIDYNPELKEFSKKLRKSSTPGEKAIWNRIKGKRLKGYGFNRQKPLGKYIADFYCKKLSLVIELDGRSHNDKQENDNNRDKELNALDLKILRFSELIAVKNPEIIENAIIGYILEHEEKSPQPHVRQAQCRPLKRGS
jgi:very-short-patch-repair endonuclease